MCGCMHMVTANPFDSHGGSIICVTLEKEVLSTQLDFGLTWICHTSPQITNVHQREQKSTQCLGGLYVYH